MIKFLARLALVGGLVAGGYAAYRRLTRPAEGSAIDPVGHMPEAPIPPQNIHDLLSILACPACKNPIRLNETETELICDHCRTAYPIEDGIPVLLIDRARPLD